jgi:DNA polymerase-3 subunit gamma/tau
MLVSGPRRRREPGTARRAMSETSSQTPDRAAPQSAALGAAGYRVLARRYRPSTFADLIGQDAMVRTVSNAFETGRIPQAWILTGVRGVGKTTTARILARALNYQLPDGSIKGPTINMPAMGEHCQAIIESRHIDVLEMDAASHNGVDDVRQINDAVRYAPVSARYKVYILDEVHMLSTAAFNALLKTLEEPPPHAKFIFATTEIRKVPITVLSRCQRFDLRRVDGDLLVRHLAGIAEKEQVTAETEALALIARAAEGSVRDSLSLFDQAIAHAAGEVRADDVRQMLGLSDRARVVDLFEMLLKGDVAGALKELRDQYDSGADPAVILSDLAEFTHFVTRVKLVPSVADDLSLSEAERVRGKAFAAQLSMRVLSRTWQMLLKGLAEVQQASRPVAAAEMLLVRIAYAADLPTPDEAIRALANGTAPDTAAIAVPRSNGGGAAVSLGAPQAVAPVAAARNEAPRSAGPRAMAAPALSAVPRPAEAPAAQVLAIGSFEELVQLAADKRDLRVKTALERDVRLVRCEDGQLEIALEPGASQAIVNELPGKLKMWTGRPWVVVLSREQGQPTLKAQMDAREAELKRGVRADPLVQAVLERFPGAEIVAVRPRETEPPLAGPDPDSDMLPDYSDDDDRDDDQQDLEG